jgi:hypothetical protein
MGARADHQSAIDASVDSREHRRGLRVDLHAVGVGRIELESKLIAREAMTTAQAEESRRLGLGHRESGNGVTDPDAVDPVAPAARVLESPGRDERLREPVPQLSPHRAQ